VRSTKNPKKIEPLKKAFGKYFDQLELVEADLLDENSLMHACSGSTYIVHTASPFPIENPRNEDELIKPAVEGTLAIMKAARKNKVKRVIITSSIAAIMVSQDENKTNFSVEDWSDTTIA
jgi:nucleoside-diphosphate-sugar epimerase